MVELKYQNLFHWRGNFKVNENPLALPKLRNVEIDSKVASNEKISII